MSAVQKSISSVGAVVVGFLAVAALPASARAANLRFREEKLTVCVDKSPDPVVIEQAESLAGRMFLSVGLVIQWRGLAACAAAAPELPLLIHLSTDTRRDSFPGALAVCRPFDGIHGEVFYDRIRVAGEPRVISNLLAHVLVHEITHLLERTDRHSDSGVMKARWGAHDLWQMGQAPLAFSQADLLLIQSGLEFRKHAMAEADAATDRLAHDAAVRVPEPRP